MIKFKRSIYVGLIFSILIAISSTYIAKALDQKNILVIHSYNEGFAWTNSISNGINSIFLEDGINANIKFDYLDLKEKSDPEYIEHFFQLQKSKYENIKFDIIIASDNGALEYISKYGKSLFSDTPVVFCGINYIHSSSLRDYPLFKIVLERIDVESMIKNIRDLMPKVTNIKVLGSNSDSGVNDMNEIKTISRYYENVFEFDFYENMPLSKVETLLENSNENTAFIFITDPILDENQRYRYINNLDKDIFKNSKSPLFSFWDFDIGSGTIGGLVTSGLYQGREAASIALDYLKGKSITDIPSITVSPNKYIYDYNELLRFNVPIDKLPEHSIIINKPFSFYEKYKSLIIITLVTFLSLIIVIAFLSLLINQKKKSEIILSNSYEELSAVYEELTATEEELRAQYEELVENEDIIRNSEERYRLAIEGANDAIWEWDIMKKTFFISDKWVDITGHSKPLDFYDIYNNYIHEKDKLEAKETLLSAINHNHLYRSEFRIISKDGSIKWLFSRGKILLDYSGNPIKIAGSITDITERKESEKQIELMAYYDCVTNLPSRTYFMENFRRILKNNKNKNINSALIFLDLDEFKKINDTLGHDIGDFLLKSIGDKLKSVIPPNALVGRFGGDEFLVLIPEVMDEGNIDDVCIDILTMFKEPFYIRGINHYVTTSIGIAISNIDGNDADTLLKNADTAMYKAKEQGKNQFCYFTQIMGKELLRKISIENQLRTALENNEFELYYQPQVDLSTGAINGMEALIRWKNPQLGVVPPIEFIPIAEKTGMIIPIGNWVLEKACVQAKLWLDNGFKFNSIAINVSCIQFIRPEFISLVKNVLFHTGLPSSFLDIEITESLLIDSTEDNINKLHELKGLGVKISLDDFGTGYSSLNYLRSLPISVLKIDRSFVQEICDKQEQRVIIDLIIKLSHKLGYKVIAEGIETRGQLMLLESMGCDIAQGYYFSKPIKADDMEKLLENTTNS